MSKAKEIIDGWGNYLIGSNPVNLDVAEKRAEICSTCDVATWGLHTGIMPDYKFKKIQGHYCSKKKGGCGCPLSTAVRSSGYKCPLGKW